MVLKKLVTVKFCAPAFPPLHYGLKEESQVVILMFGVYKSLNFLSTGVRAPFNYFISDQKIPPFNSFPLSPVLLCFSGLHLDSKSRVSGPVLEVGLQGPGRQLLLGLVLEELGAVGRRRTCWHQQRLSVYWLDFAQI